MRYLYLHGFASSPRSAKAKYLRGRFESVGLDLHLVDLNQDDFTHLTLTRQIEQVEALIHSAPTPVTLIGSSFGGLTAAWLGERNPQVEQLVLMAPAFQFLSHWIPTLGQETLDRWRSEGFIEVCHYGAGRKLPLHYGFMTDVEQYDETQLRRSLPTLILHGRRDEVIPIQASEAYCADDRPWVKLMELADDHALTKAPSKLWFAIREFCCLEPLCDPHSVRE